MQRWPGVDVAMRPWGDWHATRRNPSVRFPSLKGRGQGERFRGPYHTHSLSALSSRSAWAAGASLASRQRRRRGSASSSASSA